MNLNLIAPINNVSYGLVSTNLIVELINKGVKVALLPIGQCYCEPKYNKAIISSIENLKFFDSFAPSLKIFHQFAMSDSIGRGERIGFPIFELEQFTTTEQHHLNSLDRIIVTSNWAKNVIEQNIPQFHSDRIKIVPLGVDRSIFHENVINESYNDKVTTFLNIGKWEIRKGHDVLLEAFSKAFDPNDKVRLIMHSHDVILPQRNKEWETFYKTNRMSDNIHFTSGRVNSQDEIAKLIALADCGVFPSRAEGWCMPLLECMSMGKPVIATFSSAQTEYCNRNNTMLIEFDTNDYEPAFDPPWFNGNQGHWRKFTHRQVEQLINYMRIVHKMKKTNDLQPNIYGIETAKKYTWSASADALINGILN